MEYQLYKEVAMATIETINLFFGRNIMIYLDNGATSFPKPKGMIDTMAKCMMNYCGNPGRSGHYMAMKTAEEIYNTRKEIARLFNISTPERIVFVNNTTMALNMGIKGVLEQNDHVITTAMEHNSVLRPLKAMEKFKVDTTILKCSATGQIDPELIMGVVKENTRLIVVTHASNVTGTIMPISEIGRKIAKLNQNRDSSHQILFMVDGAQSAGSIVIDAEKMKIDLLAVPGHKGLLGPLGTGVLFVREGIDLKPLMEGGTGTDSKNRLQPTEFPEGYEMGTVNAPGIIGLGYSVNFIKSLGIEAIANYETKLVSRLDSALRDMAGVRVYGPSNCKQKTGIVTLNVENKSCEEVCKILNEQYGIASRGGFHCAGLAHKTIGTWNTGAVRLSLGAFNTNEQIEKAIDAIYNISRS